MACSLGSKKLCEYQEYKENDCEDCPLYYTDLEQDELDEEIEKER